MSQDLAQGIVETARMLEAASNSKRRYATVRFYPNQSSPWFVFGPSRVNKSQHDSFAEALNALADNGFFISPTEAKEYLAKCNDQQVSMAKYNIFELLTWTDM